jgi:hypothetical protein
MDPDYLGKDYLSIYQIALLKGLYGDRMSAAELRAFKEMTEGREPRKGGYRRAAWIIGTRAGKSDLGAVCGSYECVRWGPALVDLLMPGQVATGIIIAENKKQAGIVRGYLEGNFRTLEEKGFQVLAPRSGQSRAVTGEVIRLRWPVEIVIYPASRASVRGVTGLFSISDEIAWWRSEEGAYNQDKAVLQALRSRFGTLARLKPKQLLISSPNEESGALYAAWQNRARSQTMVAQAPTQLLNPSIPQDFFDEEREADPDAYARDYLAKFQKPGGGNLFLPGDLVDRCIDAGRTRTPPKPGFEYVAGIDAAFKRDRFALAVGHRELERAPIDLVRHWEPKKHVPLDPEEVVRDVAEELRPYGVDRVYGDQFADVVLIKLFRAAGFQYVERPQTAPSAFDMWKNVRAILRSHLTSLPDHPEMRLELRGLIATKTKAQKHAHVGAPNLKGHFDDISTAIAVILRELLPVRGAVDIAELNQGGLDKPQGPSRDWKPVAALAEGEDPLDSAFENVMDLVL